jgi:hypothetical protein
MDLKEKRWEDVDWIHVAQNRDCWWVLVKTAVSRVERSIKCGKFLNFSRRTLLHGLTLTDVT